MLCLNCNSVFGIRRGEDFVCPNCGQTVNVGEKYILVSNERRDGKPRAAVHNGILHSGAVCYIDVDNFVPDCFFNFCKQGMFHVECDDPNNYLHNINTSPVEESMIEGDTFGVITSNTVYVFKKAEDQ